MDHNFLFKNISSLQAWIDNKLSVIELFWAVTNKEVTDWGNFGESRVTDRSNRQGPPLLWYWISAFSSRCIFSSVYSFCLKSKYEAFLYWDQNSLLSSRKNIDHTWSAERESLTGCAFQCTDHLWLMLGKIEFSSDLVTVAVFFFPFILFFQCICN